MIVKQEAAWPLALNRHGTEHFFLYAALWFVVRFLCSCVHLGILQGSLGFKMFTDPKMKKTWLWSIHIALSGGSEAVGHEIHFLRGFWG